MDYFENHMYIESLKLFLDVRNFSSLTNAANINYIT